MIYSDCPLSIYLALMISSAAIERSLGDVSEMILVLNYSLLFI